MSNYLRNYRCLEEALADISRKEEGIKWLGSLTERDITHICEKIYCENWYNDISILDISAQKIWTNSSIREYLKHQIWCAYRDALCSYSSHDISSQSITYRFINEEHLIATERCPTIILSPMCLGTYDAINLMLETLKQFQPNRPFVFYGEDMYSYFSSQKEHASFFAMDNIAGMKKILNVLNESGIFITYPDFVYKNHSSIVCNFLGIPRHFSLGFIKISLISKARLLPINATSTFNTINLRFHKAVIHNTSNDFQSLNSESKLKLQCMLISQILAGLVYQSPNQWRLLPTLTHEYEE